jgi:hypothetical protein
MSRDRYPELYKEGDNFIVWANNYTRVLQTAQMFVRGYLGPNAGTQGRVAAVTSTGYPGAIGNSLAPSDMCPNFLDSQGGSYATEWANIYIPPIQKRLQAMITGNLTLTANDISQMPYLCGFESQITGRLSPWCNIFTDEELKQYEYSNDLRYYYGVGPGTKLESTMMMPFLNSLVGLLRQGPSLNGTDSNGSSFALPKLLLAFVNDGQLVELITGSGVFDNHPALSSTTRDDRRLFIASRFVTMRGTVAFERLNCVTSPGVSSKSTTTKARRQGCSRPTPSPRNSTYLRIRLNDAVYTTPGCDDGPGSSCLLDSYSEYVRKKYSDQGNWASKCNVTLVGAPTAVSGASFFTDLSSPWVRMISP